MELKDRLKLLREEKGLTMDMFVWDMNTKYNIELNKGLVSKWENGVNEPSLRYAGYLAKYYDVSLDYLIGLTDVKTPARLLAYAKKIQSAAEANPRPSLHDRYISNKFNSSINRNMEAAFLDLDENNEDRTNK